MDPVTLNRLAQIRQQEILKYAVENQGGILLRPLVGQLGILLIAAGQKLMVAARLEEQPIPSNINNVNMENC